MGDGAPVYAAELTTPPDPSAYLDEFGILPKSPASQVTLTVFDQIVYTQTATLVAVRSNPVLNGMLGAFDQYAIEVVVDHVSDGINDFAVDLEHSGDGVLWEAKTKQIIPTVATLTPQQTTTL